MYVCAEPMVGITCIIKCQWMCVCVWERICDETMTQLQYLLFIYEYVNNRYFIAFYPLYSPASAYVVKYTCMYHMYVHL